MRGMLQFKVLLILLFVFANTALYSSQKNDSLLIELNLAISDTAKINILQELFTEYFNNEDYVTSVKYANECIQLCNNLDSDTEGVLAKSNSILGKSYSSMGLFSKALDFHTKSLISYQKNQDTSNIALEYLLIGAIYKHFGKKDLVKINLEKALELALKTNNKILISSIYNNMGNLYSLTQKWDSAINYYHKSLDLRIKTNGKGYFAPYMNISRSYANINELDSARKYLVIASKYIDNNTYHKSAYLYNFASINVLEKDFTSAEKNLIEALSFSKNKKLNNVTVLVYNLLSEIHNKQKNYKKALKYHLMYSHLKDSISINNEEEIISKVELLFESEKNSMLIEKLNAQNEVERTKIKALGIVIGLVMLIAIIFFIQKNNLRKAYEKIVEENVKFLSLKKTNQELKEEIRTIAENSNNTTITQKYKDSSLTDEYKSELANKIINALEKDKIFTKLDLKVRDLADYLDVNRTYISQVLTEEIKVSFIELINSYRIEEAKYLLSDDQYSKLTISAIAEMSGFTPSTFNRVFKNQTGVTPSFFMKNSKKV